MNATPASVRLSLDAALAVAEEHAAAGRHGAATEVLRQILRVAPDHPAAELALARALQAQGRLPAAIDFLQAAAARRPGDGAVRLAFGEFLLTQGRRADAALVLAQAAELIPGDARPALLAGRCSLELGRHELAMVHLQAAISRDPLRGEAYRLLGRALAEIGRGDEASVALRKAVALAPADADGHAELGRLLALQGRTGEAIDSFHLAVALAPQSPGLEHERAQLLLRRGNYPHGWLAYESRMVERARRREFPVPRWQGEALDGRRLLIHAEPDLAETIQFLRLAAALPAGEGAILLELPLDLIGLAAHSLADLGLRAVRRGGTDAFDLHCPLPSLAGLLKVPPDAIPGRVPYLRPTMAASGRWQRRLATLLPRGGLRVGLATDQPVALRPGMLPVWLERGRPAPAGTLPLAREIGDLSDLAAIIAELDLVIGEDRPAVHLAGALGKPAWVLLPHVAHWRWLEARADSPWYPTVRLFRESPEEGPADFAERLRAALSEGL